MALDLLFLNGELIKDDSLEGSIIDFQDRAFHYGDGVFETIRIHQGEIPTWDYHLQRLKSAQAILKLPLDEFFAGWPEFAKTHLALISSGCAKLIISRGIGPRGYAIPAEVGINWWLKISDLPHESKYQIKNKKRLTVCEYRLSRQPVLAGLKHLNRLDQVMARSEFIADQNNKLPDEGVMLNYDGDVVECTTSNIFWREGQSLFTPSLDKEGVNGCVRRWLLDYQNKEKNSVQVAQSVSLDRLFNADSVYISNSLMGLQPVVEILGKQIVDSSGSETCLLEEAAIAFDRQYEVEDLVKTQVEVHD